MFTWARPLCTLLVAASLGCAHSVERRDWTAYDGPGAASFHADEIDPPSFPDPLEPANRAVSAFNHVLITFIASPLGTVYRLVIPRYVRERGRDFAANLVWPRNLAANLLQAKWRAAGTETARFAINSTVGIAGLWDPAARWWEIEAEPEDFGQVFGAWGWRPSTFVVLPVYGPSTLRDAVGLVPDTYLDPASHYFPASYVLAWNDLVDSIPDYQRLVASSFDPYDDARIVWTLNRDEEISDGRLPVVSRSDDTGAVQTLELAFLAPRDPEFWTQLRTGRAVIPATGRRLPYSYRLQPGRAPVVFLAPGLGTHRLGASTLALAEMSWERGFSVVLMSSALSFEFMERAASVSVPGHAPVDARDLHAALEAVASDLYARHPDRLGARVFMGYSLGAFHGFFIAAEDADPASERMRFDRYVLLDPPVRLVHGLERLDRFYNAPLVYPEPDRAEQVQRILRKALLVAKAELEKTSSRFEATGWGSRGLEPSRALPFTNLEAEYLIGLAFRRTLQSVLWVSQTREDLGVLRTQRGAFRRWAAYEEIADYSYAEYLYGFVLPYYRDRLGLLESPEQLVAENDLHAIEGPLRANPKLRVFANRNDFLTSGEDIDWLTELVGDGHVAFFPTGGHLGNLHQPAVQRAIMDSLADLLPPSTAAR
ncbi:MAG TPA: VacJ family lipoprotein [Myxococcota bacterium]